MYYDGTHLYVRLVCKTASIVQNKHKKEQHNTRENNTR